MRYKAFCWLLFVQLFLSASLGAESLTSALREAMGELGLAKGDFRLCVLTNAGYVTMGGEGTHQYIDLFTEETGASIGRGNLLFVHSAEGSPLKIALFRRDTGACIFIRYRGEDVQKMRTNLSLDEVIDQGKWTEIQKALGPDAFPFASILGAWARGAPYDLLKAAEFHNHLCPGVTSGYFIAKFARRYYPLGEGQSYRFIACPPWCKDDAIQVLLDLTPGKKGLYVMDLSEEQKEALPDPDVAGVLVLWDEPRGTGKALILKFKWEDAYRISGVKPEEIRPKGSMNNPLFWTSRVKAVLGLIPYLDEPGRFVEVLAEIPVDAAGLARMSKAGSNPYEVLGYKR